jgi:ABC-type antimicrobial peptide transport system permease subunit
MRIWFERHRSLIDFTMASLLRRKAKNGGLIAVYTLLIFTLGSLMLFGSAIRREATAALEGAPEITAQAMRMGRHELTTQPDLDKIGILRGVKQIEGRLWGYLFDSASGANYTLQVPPPTDVIHTVAPGESIVGEGVARLRNLTPGKYLFLVSPSGKFLKTKVKAVLPSDSALVSTDLVLLNPADFRSFYELPPDVFTDIAVKVSNPKEIATVAEKIALALPTFRFITRGDLLRTYEAVFSWREGLLLALVVGALLAFAILAWDKASGLSAEERREIGILKAIGWETRDIIAMKLWEGGLISLTAFLAGVVFAYGHVFFFSATLIEPLLKGWATLYPRFPLAPDIDVLQIATLAFFSIVPYMAAILVPVWRTATADPDIVMR